MSISQADCSTRHSPISEPGRSETGNCLLPSGRTLRPATPGMRVYSRIEGGRQVIFYGACTPFRARLMEQFGLRDVWLSSFELSSLLGERDDESIGAVEVRYFFDRIRKKCPEANIFVDCDTGWNSVSENMAGAFTHLAGSAAMVCVENLRCGQKDNSFRPRGRSCLASAHEVVQRLRTIADACQDVLVVLRVENNVLGASIPEIRDYLKALRDEAAPFDLLLLHHAKQEIDTLLRLGELFYTIYSSSTPLAAIATAYATVPDWPRLLDGAGFKVLVLPNHAVRAEHHCLATCYAQLARAEFVAAEGMCSPMAAVMGVTYDAEEHLARDPVITGPMKRLLFCPGPTNVADEVRLGLLNGDMFHREPSFAALMRETEDMLLDLLGGTATHSAIMFGASGTGANEAMLSLVNGKALVIVNGAYSRRLVVILQRHRIAYAELTVPLLEAVDPYVVERVLEADPELTHLVVVHVETTTGVVAPLSQLGRIAARLNRVFMVDAIAGVGSHVLNLEADHIDFCSITPNKALEALPGIAYVLARSTTLEAQSRSAARGYYLDICAHWQCQRSGQPAFTVPIQVLTAFRAALLRLKREGYEQRVQRYRSLAWQMRHGLAALGLNVVLPSDVKQVSNAITLFDLPATTPYESLVSKLGRRGLVIYSDPETVRLGRACVATMGAIDASHVRVFLEALADILDECKREFAGPGQRPAGLTSMTAGCKE